MSATVPVSEDAHASGRTPAAAQPKAAAAEPAQAADRPRVLAPLHLRLFALLFDYAVIVAGVKLVQQALLGERWDLRPLQTQAGWAALASPWQGAMLLLVLLRDAPGNSVGKWLTDLAIRRAHRPAGRAGLWRRLVRNLSLIVLPADAWLVFRDPQGRRLGERWADTVLVQRPRPRDLYQRAVGLGVLFLGFILAALLVTSWNLRRSAAFQTAYAAARTDAALAAQVGGAPAVDRSPDLELNLPRAAQPGEGGHAVATFSALGPAGGAKLRVEMTLVAAQGGEPARWTVVRTEVLDATGGPLQQKPAPAAPRPN
ncbi:MAG: RDD family protein [SAR324 cluster bacterium]